MNNSICETFIFFPFQVHDSVGTFAYQCLGQVRILGIYRVVPNMHLANEAHAAPPPPPPPSQPLPVAAQYAASEADGVDILASDLAPRVSGAYRINVIADAVVTFSIEIKDEDGVLLDVGNFNAGSTIAADAGYGFTWIVRKGNTYNFQATGAAAAVTLEVDFIKDGTT